MSCALSHAGRPQTSGSRQSARHRRHRRRHSHSRMPIGQLVCGRRQTERRERQ
jgi:hypothetical protein